MLFRMLSALPLLALNLFVYFLLSSAQVHGRQSCDQGYNVCSPPGTSAHEDQFIETHLADLYMNLLTTVNPQDGAQPKLFDAAGPRSASGLQLSNLPEAVCCKFITQGCSETGDLTVIGAETTECLLLNTWNVPLCWVFHIQPSCCRVDTEKIPSRTASQRTITSRMGHTVPSPQASTIVRQAARPTSLRATTTLQMDNQGISMNKTSRSNPIRPHSTSRLHTQAVE